LGSPFRYGIETESLTNGIRVERIAPPTATKSAAIDKGTKGLLAFFSVARERLALKEERHRPLFDV